MARAVGEFEAIMKAMKEDESSNTKHHEEIRGTELAFAKDVSALVKVVESMGNPFQETSEDLIVLDSKDIADPAVVTTVKQVEALGEAQFQTFVTERLVQRTKPLSEPIKRNKLALCSSPPPKDVSKTKQQSLKSDCSLFSRLYISCQTREGNLEEFFKHENQACLPSLSHLGKLRLPSNKAVFTACLESYCHPWAESPENVDAIIVDGAAVVNMLKPGTCKTFSEYSPLLFLPYLQAQLQHASRLDIVWDVCIPNSLKATARGNRGGGIRRRVQATNHLPRDWNGFLRLDENKTELFKFFAEETVTLGGEKQVISTLGDQFISYPPRVDVSNLAPCSHEEADTRMLLHAAGAANQGFRKILIRTVATDVVVLSVAPVPKFQPAELWLAFGVEVKSRYLPGHEISQSIGQEMSEALPFFHALKGCM